MASRDGPKPSKETLARLREVQRRLNDIYETEPSDAENARVAKLLPDIVEAEALSIESELHLRPIFSTNFKATVGADTSKATLFIVLGLAVAILVVLFVGIYVLLNSSAGARLWK